MGLRPNANTAPGACRHLSDPPLITRPCQIPCPHAFDQPVHADMLVKLGVAPCVLHDKTVTAPALAAAIRRAALPGPERSKMLSAAQEASRTILAEAAGALPAAVRALEGVWATHAARKPPPLDSSSSSGVTAASIGVSTVPTTDAL